MTCILRSLPGASGGLAAAAVGGDRVLVPVPPDFRGDAHPIGNSCRPRRHSRGHRSVGRPCCRRRSSTSGRCGSADHLLCRSNTMLAGGALSIRSGTLHIFLTAYCSCTVAPGGVWNSNSSSGRLSQYVIFSPTRVAGPSQFEFSHCRMPVRRFVSVSNSKRIDLGPL